MPRRLVDYRGVWSGETVYVVGSSAALDRFDPRWFDDKRTIAINFVGPRFGLHPDTLTVTQYTTLRPRLRELGWDGVVFEPDRRLPNHDCGPDALDDNTVAVPYPDAVSLDLPEDPDPPYLIQGGTSLHPALHLAAYTGATTIVTVAADHGWWNDQRNAEVYAPHTGPGTDILIPKWHTETDRLAANLRARGVTLHTLLPYVNLLLEGDRFKGPRARIG